MKPIVGRLRKWGKTRRGYLYDWIEVKWKDKYLIFTVNEGGI